jgi:hypothetical protein
MEPWKLISGTPNYEYGPLVAVYQRTDRSGFGVFYTFPKSTPPTKRRAGDALSMGGLPSEPTLSKLAAQERAGSLVGGAR